MSTKHKLRPLAAIVGTLVFNVGCNEVMKSPTAPEIPAPITSPQEIVRIVSGLRGVFKVEPPLVENVISGAAPLRVEFGMCQTTGASARDEVTFTYDFDGDKTVDFRGHCRATHAYTAAEAGGCVTAKVCATSTETGQVLCQE
jgi:hypothetical protein